MFTEMRKKESKLAEKYPLQGILKRAISFTNGKTETAFFSQGASVRYRLSSEGFAYIPFKRNGKIAEGATINFELFE